MSDLESKMVDTIPFSLPENPAIMWRMGGALGSFLRGSVAKCFCALVKPEAFKSADVT